MKYILPKALLFLRNKKVLKTKKKAWRVLSFSACRETAPER